MLKNFRTYQLALTLVKEGRKLKLKGVYRDQLERALLSIVLNLAEGSAKPSKADRRRFYLIALGSLRESQAIIEILEINELKEKADFLGKSLYCLTRSLSHPSGQGGPSGTSCIRSP